MTLLEPFFRRLEQIPAWQSTGRVTKAVGFLVESDGPCCSVGECCEIVDGDGIAHAGEVGGFRGHTVLSMPFNRIAGVRFGDRVITRGTAPSVPVGESLLGRVIDATGEPLDSLGGYRALDYRALYGTPPQPLDRTPIKEALCSRRRAIAGILACGA